MNERTRTYLFRTAAFLAAGGFLYLALRQVDLAAVGDALVRADYRWVLPLVAITLLSHLLRAWRWQLLLNTLPGTTHRSARPGADPHRVAEDGAPGDPTGSDPANIPSRLTDRVGILPAFGSLMIGYMVNYAAPRLGEIARTANLSRQERLPFTSVLGTVVVERALDMVILLCALGSVVVLLADRLGVIGSMIGSPVERLMAQPGADWAVAGAAALLVVLGVTAGFWAWATHTSGGLRSWWAEHVQPLVRSFVDGFRTLFHTGRPGSIILSTTGMWFGYVLMAYVPFLMLDMAGPYELGLVQTWVIMAVGALGIAVPVPGGTGSYHYVTIQALTLLYGVGASAAATYAVLTHGLQLIIYVIVGLGFFLWEGATWKRLRRPDPEHDSDPDSDPVPSSAQTTRSG